MSAELIEASIRVVIDLSSDGITIERSHQAIFAVGATASDAVEFVRGIGIFSDQGLRVLRMDRELIDGLLPATFLIARCTNPIRVEVIPREQADLTPEDLIPVCYPSKKTSFLIEMVPGERFTETRTRIQTRLQQVLQNIGRLGFVLVRAARDEVEMADESVLWNEAQGGSRLMVFESAKKTLRILCNTGRSASLSLKLPKS